MNYSAHRWWHGFAAGLLAFATALLRVQAEDEVLIKELVSREYSIHVGGVQTPEIKEIASREVSLFILNGPADPFHEVISREVSVALVTPEPPPPVRPVVRVSPVGDRVDLEWSAYNPWTVRDVARFDVYLSDHPFTTVAGLTPVASVNGESTAATLTGLPTFRDHFLAVVAVDALGNAELVVTYSGAYVISPEVVSREVSVFIGAEPVPAYREVVSREVSLVLTTPEPPAAVAKVVTRGTPSGSGVTLDWSAYNPWAERDVARFDIYFSDRPFATVAAMTQHASVPGEALFAQFDGLPEFRDHFFAVVPVDALGNFGPAVNYAGVYVISPEVVSREVSLFVGAEPDPPYRQVASRELSLLVADTAVPDPVTGVDTNLKPATSETALGAIDLDWTKYNEVKQRDVVRYRVYWDTAYFDNVNSVTNLAYVADGAQTYVLSGLKGNGIYFVAVVAEDAYGQFDPLVQSTLAQASPALEPPSFVLQPLSRSVRADGEVTLSATVEGTPPFNYRWYRDGHQVVGATGPTLTLPSVSADDAGRYTVEVEGPVGRILSEPATLEVLVPPAITLLPQPATVRAGESATFTVVAEGMSPLSFDWLFNGVSLGAASRPELPLSGLSAANSGLISVRITNEVGSVISPPARLRVIELGRFVRVPPPLTRVDLDDSLELSVEAAGTEPITFQWRLNGQDLPGETNAVYRVPKVRLEHAGIYTVVLINEAGAVTSDPVEVRINLPERPGNDAFARAAELTVPIDPISGSNAAATREDATGEPNHAAKRGAHSVWYQWLAPFSGSMTLRTSGSAFDTLLAVYTGSTLGTLTEEASDDDATRGGYFTSEVIFNATAGVTYFIAVDGLGGAVGNYVLSGEFAPHAPLVPRITRHPESQTQVLGGPVELRVEAENATEITWQLNGEPLPGVSGSPLVISNVAPANVGTYVAMVSGGGTVVYSHPAIVEIGPDQAVRSYDKPEELTAAAASVAPGGRVRPQIVSGVPALALSPGRPAGLWVNNQGYTTQLGETNHCGVLLRRTGWLLVGVVTNGHLVITATNTTVPVVLTLYPYPYTKQSQALACGTGGTLVLADARSTDLYEVMYGSADNTGGAIRLECSVGVPPPPPPPPAASVAPVDVPIGTEVTLTAPKLAGVMPPPAFQWRRNGQPIPGAQGETLVLPAFTAAAAGDYSVEFDNGIGQSVFPVAGLAADLPLGPPEDGGAGLRGGVFRLTGNPGQRVAVSAGSPFTLGGAWNFKEEFWLPEEGREYRDDAFATHDHWFFGYREIPLTVMEDPPLSDGRRTWRVSGGRLGKTFQLEASTNGQNWTPVRTNQVTEGSFLHIEPAGSPPSLQFRAINAPAFAIP